MLEPLTRFSEQQLEHALDEALTKDEMEVVWRIIGELDRRGILEL